MTPKHTLRYRTCLYFLEVLEAITGDYFDKITYDEIDAWTRIHNPSSMRQLFDSMIPGEQFDS